MKNTNIRTWRVRSGGIVASIACVIGTMGLSSATASAEPTVPQPTVPAVVDTVAATPAAITSPTTAAVVQPALVPAASGTLADFFRDKGVTMERQVPQGFTALNIVLPMPPSWAQVPNPNVPDAFVVLADKNGGDLYTANAQLVVYKLAGDFDSREAITHGFIDSQMQPGWQATDASLAEFGGFPSSRIEGTYRSNSLILNASRRNVIAQSGSDRYLLTLTVTTTIGQAVSASPATDAIINGFRVSDPAAPPPAAAPVAPAVPAAPAPTVAQAPAAVGNATVPTT